MAKKRKTVSLKNVFLYEGLDQFDLDQENLMDKGFDDFETKEDISDNNDIVLTLNFLLKDAAKTVSYRAEELGVEINDESVEKAIEQVFDFVFDEFGEVTTANLEADYKELSAVEKRAFFDKIKNLALKEIDIAKEELQYSQTGFADIPPAVVKEYDDEYNIRRSEAVGYRLQETIAKMEKLMRDHVKYHLKISAPGTKASDIFTPEDLADDLEKELMALDRDDEIDYSDILDMADQVIREMSAKDTLMEKAPPGMEDVVMSLKKKFGEDSPRPFQIAWAQYNKKHGKKTNKKVNEEVNFSSHLKLENKIENEMRKALREYEKQIIMPGKRVSDMASDLVDLIQGEIFEFDKESVFSYQDYLDMAHDIVSEFLSKENLTSPVEQEKQMKMDRMDLDSDKFELMEAESPGHMLEKALEAVRAANSYVTFDDPNMAMKMSSIARDYGKQMKAPELYNTDKDELAEELVSYFISNMTDANEDYQDALLEPDERYSNAAEAAGMHREEAYVFSKFPKRLLARAIIEFYSR